MGLDSLLDSSLQRLRARVALPAWRALPVGRALPAWMLLPLLAIPALWPLYREGLPRTIDGGLHLLRISLLDDYIRAGMFYPRWVSEMQLGHGYPLFSFYAPGFYYLTILLQRLGLSDYQAFIAASCLLVVLAGIGMERLARDSFAGAPGQRAGALLAAIAYMYAPFLFSNIYTSGALPAAAGQALLPWTLWSYRRLLYAKRPANYVLPGALFLAAVAITHNLTLVFLAPVLLVYTLVCWRQAGAGWGRLLWLAATLGLAAGVSAFFWLPVLIEQRYLTETGRLISTTQWLPRNFWRWDNFLDLGFFYPYSYNRPVKLGLVQLGLAALGWLAAKRRDPEWMTLLGLAVGLSLFMGEWAMPIWLATPILALTQFPWRLLAITSLLLALMAGGLLLHLRPTILRTATLAVAALTLILAQQPRLGWADLIMPETLALAPPVLAQLDLEKGLLEGGEGNSSIQEFKPRWTDLTLSLDPDTVQPGAAVTLHLLEATPVELRATVHSPADTLLRFTGYFFPGWRAFLDGRPLTAVYPSTNLGLLTVDLPAGDHTLHVRWTGTPLHTLATVLSLLCLAALAVIAWQARPRPRENRPEKIENRPQGAAPYFLSSTSYFLSQTPVRWTAALPLALLAMGLAALLMRPSPQPIHSPAQPVVYEGVQLAGWRVSRDEPSHLTLLPYWYVTETPDEDLRVRWVLSDRAGRELASSVAFPYYNTFRASNWPAQTLVDDAYRLALPPGLAAGVYQVGVRLGDSVAALAQPPLTVGEVTIESPIAPAPALPNPLDARLGESIALRGYALAGDAERAGGQTILRPGQRLRVSLYWQATGQVQENYHGFVHLVDHAGRPVAQEDQLPGPLFHPPLLWDTIYPQQDIYLLRLPDDLPGGLYWPHVGLYDFDTLDRLPVRLETGTEILDHVTLPPIKVVSARAPDPTQPLQAQFGEWGELLGYDLVAPADPLRPGEQFTVRLYYRSRTAAPGDFTRFLQLYNETAGVAAQTDSPPRQGGNPTSSWMAGEVIVDEATLTIAADAAPGEYTLYLGFYPSPTPAERVPLYSANGERLQHDWLPLATLRLDAP